MVKHFVLRGRHWGLKHGSTTLNRKQSLEQHLPTYPRKKEF